jgi:hypothetical protein
MASMAALLAIRFASVQNSLKRLSPFSPSFSGNRGRRCGGLLISFFAAVRDRQPSREYINLDALYAAPKNFCQCRLVDAGKLGAAMLVL